VVFANPGTSFIEAGRVAVQVLSKPVYCHGTECFLGALAQCRDTSLIGARKLSRCRIYIAGRCACPGASFSRICLGSRSKSKNHDEQLTHIVRVRHSSVS
jgi:hypothetical protein